LLYPNIDNPFDILENCICAFIIKEIDPNVFNSFELKIRYKIYVKDNLGNLIFLFKAKETSGLINRNCIR
jgi:hypothetical protein